MRQQDGERTLFYLDPPYVHGTRATTHAYAYEMDMSAHQALLVLDTIQHCQGRVMLSGYPNELYDQTLRDWNRHDREIDNKVSGAASKRVMIESIWCNFQ